MSNTLTINPGLLNLLPRTSNAASFPQPFARDIPLLETCIAGTSFRDLTQIEPDINAGDELIMRREPGNEHDTLAIKILTRDETHIGFIPRAKNEVLSNLMDAGKMLCARVTSKEWENDWLKIDVQILMREL